MDNKNKQSDDKVNPSASLHTICPILVGVAGGSSSGKTTLCNKIVSQIGLSHCTVIPLDSFYKGVAAHQAKNYNFDHPDALDFDLCFEVVKQLLARQETSIPIYNFKTHQREAETTKVVPRDMILLEGILALHDPRIVALMNLKIFVDCDDDIRLYRRLLRDVKERGRDVAGIIFQYNKFVKPAFEDFIGPSMKFANIIVPGNHDNTVAINFIVQNLKSQLSRLEDLKRDMNSNFYHIDILDSCWLNVQDDKQHDPNELALYHSNNILFLRDPNAKTECINVFNLLSSQFSKTLYQLSMVRLLTYGVKIMKRYDAHKQAKTYRMLYYLKGTEEIEKEIGEVDSVGIIVPFLHDDVIEDIQKKIDTLLSKKESIQLFVISMLGTMNAMTKMTMYKDNIYMINILCIVNMNFLLKTLQENCKVPDFDFVANKDFIDVIEDISIKEINKKEV